jgi:hypothetical protein
MDPEISGIGVRVLFQTESHLPLDMGTAAASEDITEDSLVDPIDTADDNSSGNGEPSLQQNPPGAREGSVRGDEQGVHSAGSSDIDSLPQNVIRRGTRPRNTDGTYLPTRVTRQALSSKDIGV